MNTLQYVSVGLTALFVIIGIFRLITRNATDESTTPSSVPRDTPSSDSGKDFWGKLGLVDDTPNLIRAVVAGGTGNGPILYFIDNVPGRIYDSGTKKMRDLEPGEDRYKDEGFLERIVRNITGKRVYGLPFIRSFRPIKIDRVVKKEARAGGVAVALEDQLDATGLVTKYALYGQFYRPTYHPALDTDDGVRFATNSYALLRVVDPEPAFTVYKDSLLQTVDEIKDAFISSQVLKLKWEEYKDKGSDTRDGEANESKFDLTIFNKMLKPTGLEAVQLTFSDPEIFKGAPELQKALEQKKIAEEKAHARRAEGEGEKDYHISVAEGQAKGLERLAQAKARRFDELFNSFKGKFFSDEDAAREANELIKAEFNADAVSKLTGVYAPGGHAGVQLSVPTRQEKVIKSA